jgi:hypothetical protein
MKKLNHLPLIFYNSRKQKENSRSSSIVLQIAEENAKLNSLKIGASFGLWLTGLTLSVLATALCGCVFIA